VRGRVDIGAIIGHYCLNFLSIKCVHLISS